ncbi:MAG: glycoside hydrolase family 5 protein [Chloroflexi bacterium]|nr:glycoside hydrolase family 5 protein [Chloroflexota bacterium]
MKDSLRDVLLLLTAITLVALTACSNPAAPASEPSAPTEPTAEETLYPTITPEGVEAKAELTPTARPLPPPQEKVLASPEYGMQVFPWWRPEVGSRDMQVVRDAGFTWVKVGFGWREIEGAAKGAFDWTRTDMIVDMANDIGVKLLIRIDHQPEWAGGGFPLNGPPDNMQDLGDFLTALAQRYKGRVNAYQIWNEPNLAREWGGQTPDPAGFAEMLKVAYAAIKSQDDNALVISGGLSPTGTWDAENRPDDWYLETLYIDMDNNSDGYFDLLGLHAPGFKVSPETDPAEVEADPELGGTRAFCFRHIEDMRQIMVQYGDKDKQIAILEFGWTSDPRQDSPYAWHAVSEESKADYLVRAYQYAEENWSPWIGLMNLIYIVDPDWTQDNEQYWWAISDPGYPDFIARPAYNALKEMPK